VKGGVLGQKFELHGQEWVVWSEAGRGKYHARCWDGEGRPVKWIVVKVKPGLGRDQWTEV
jgi:hypothetical protein